MNVSRNPMAGYTVIKSAGEQMMERNVQPELFEVLDIDTMQKSQVYLNPKGKDGKPKKAKKRVPKDIVVEEAVEEVGAIQPVQSHEQIEEHPLFVADKEVTFITPYTEVSVSCFEVHTDQTVFSVVTPTDDRVKVKPKRGATLSAVYQGQTYNLYAAGIYLPLETLKAVVSVFFVVDETTEEE